MSGSLFDPRLSAPPYDDAIESEIPFPEPALRGRACSLRRFVPSDFDAAAELQQDESAARWVPALPGEDGASVTAFFERCRREGSLLHLVIADPGDGAYLGEAMLAIAEHGVAEVGCCVVPAVRGRGVATDALRLLTAWAFATLGLGRIQVFVATENAAALRLAEAARFTREGMLRSYFEIAGVRLDAVVLARLPTD